MGTGFLMASIGLEFKGERKMTLKFPFKTTTAVHYAGKPMEIWRERLCLAWRVL